MTPKKPTNKPTWKKKHEIRTAPFKSSKGESILALELKAMGIAFEREFKFCPTRKWKADFLLTGTRILVEVEGGVYSNGRHTRGQGYEADCEKYSTAALEGWTVLRFSTGQVKNGLAIKMIKRAVGV